MLIFTLLDSHHLSPSYHHPHPHLCLTRQCLGCPMWWCTKQTKLHRDRGGPLSPVITVRTNIIIACPLRLFHPPPNGNFFSYSFKFIQNRNKFNLKHFCFFTLPPPLKKKPPHKKLNTKAKHILFYNLIQ